MVAISSPIYLYLHTCVSICMYICKSSQSGNYSRPIQQPHARGRRHCTSPGRALLSNAARYKTPAYTVNHRSSRFALRMTLQRAN